MSEIDISREAVELAARWLHVQHGMFDEGNLILALRAALDAAEARERQAVEVERAWAVSECDAVAMRFSNAGFVDAKVGANVCAAAIRTGAKP